MEKEASTDEPEAVEAEGATAEGTAVPEEGPRRNPQKRLRVAIVIAAVAIIVIVLLWGMVPEPIYELRDAVKDLDDLRGERVSVKGVVVAWESGASNFTLSDTSDPGLTVNVRHRGTIPEGFGLNVTAVVKGVLHGSGDGLFMESDEIQIGCPSKY